MRVIKKVFSVAVLATGIISIAGASNLKTGYYVGLNGSYSYANHSCLGDLDIVGNDNLTVKPESQKENQKKTILTLGMSGGYRHIYSNGFVMGFNADFAIDRGSVRTIAKYDDIAVSGLPHFSLRVETRVSKVFQVSPALIFGKVINNKCMLFTELGVNISKFNLESRRILGVVGNFSDKTAPSTTSIGYKGGLGIEYAVNNRMSVVGMASYEWHNTVKVSIGELIENYPGKHHVGFKPQYINTSLGVRYKL